MRLPTALTAALLLTCAAAAPSWKGEVIYQVMPDRFHNGDPANDDRPVPSDPADPKGWHGGDLKGLTAKIPYIRDLGATAIWLTPVYRQVTGRDGGATGYHGCWPQDFRNVDPHFGTLADFDAFVKAAKDAGLKVMLDQVVNHYGPGSSVVGERPALFNDPATCASKGNRDVYCPIYGLPDLNQDRQDVRDLLYGNADFWRARGVDGFRYDAIKHVPETFLRDLLARDAKAGTYTLGEFYDADAGTVADYQKLGFASLFDFSLKTAMNDAIMSGRGLDRVRSVLERYGEIPAPDEVGLFLDNHDVPRFANGSLSEEDGRERTVYGLRALMTLRGIPVVWQGTEIAMRGGGDPDNRRDMRFPERWTPAEKTVADATKAAIRVRRESRALSAGNLTLLNVPATLESDVLAFTRAAGGERVLAVWHGGRARRTYSVRSDLVPNLAVVRDLYGQDAKLSFSGGFLHVSVPPRTAVVFRLPS